MRVLPQRIASIPQKIWREVSQQGPIGVICKEAREGQRPTAPNRSPRVIFSWFYHPVRLA